MTPPTLPPSFGLPQSFPPTSDRRNSSFLLTRVLTGAAIAAGFLPAALDATSYGRFQHGGRATGQVGAMVARADDATAVSYNPAGLSRLAEGWNVTVGVDFAAPRLDYASTTGEFAAQHVINFTPALYLAWRQRDSNWAFGLSVDTPWWHLSDWKPVEFPARFTTSRQEATLLELHPVASYALDDRWSVGGGLRLVRGTLGEGVNALYAFPGEFGEPVELEVQRLAEGTGDGFGIDLAVQFTENVWGFGASLRNNIEVEADVDVEYTALRLVDPVLTDIFEQNFQEGSDRLEITLPSELRLGVWLAPYPELRLEADIAYTRWSELDDSTYVFNQTFDGPLVLRNRDWDDTVSLRVAAEGDLGGAWSVFGGLAWEPSPVNADTLEPGFPRGDALVAAIGVTYRAGRATFDIGYSFHDLASLSTTGGELDTTVRSSFSGHEQVWSASGRLSF